MKIIWEYEGPDHYQDVWKLKRDSERQSFFEAMEDKDEIIEMALSDKVPFDTIKQLYGLDENQVKRLMKAELKPGSYRVWRKRVERFTKQRSSYK